MRFLFGPRSVIIYRMIAVCFIVLGACLHVNLVWQLADLFNGLMVIPNLIALWCLSKVVSASLQDFEDKLEAYSKEEK